MVKPEELGGMLFTIHTHANLVKGEQIIYKEADIIKLLEALGHPKPIFGTVLTIEEYESEKIQGKIKGS